MRRGFFVVLLLMHTVSSAAQERPRPELEPFLEEVRERLQTDRTLQSGYTYVETRRELTLDKHGRATGVSARSSTVSWCYPRGYYGAIARVRTARRRKWCPPKTDPVCCSAPGRARAGR